MTKIDTTMLIGASFEAGEEAAEPIQIGRAHV